MKETSNNIQTKNIFDFFIQEDESIRLALNDLTMILNIYIIQALNKAHENKETHCTILNLWVFKWKSLSEPVLNQRLFVSTSSFPAARTLAKMFLKNSFEANDDLAIFFNKSVLPKNPIDYFIALTEIAKKHKLDTYLKNGRIIAELHHKLFSTLFKTTHDGSAPNICIPNIGCFKLGYIKQNQKNHFKPGYLQFSPEL